MYKKIINTYLSLRSEKKTVQIQIGWLLQKQTDLDLNCLLRQGMSCSARKGLNNYFFLFFLQNCCWYSFEGLQQGTSNEYPQHVFMEK